jgi:hypothetical protein
MFVPFIYGRSALNGLIVIGLANEPEIVALNDPV